MGHFKNVTLLLFSLMLYCELLYANNGQVTFFIFKEDIPASKTKVIIDNKIVANTNDEGIIELTLSSSEHIAKIFQDEEKFQEIKFKVVNGENTFINYTLMGEREVLAPASKKYANELKKVKTRFRGTVKMFGGGRRLGNVRVLVHGLGTETLSNNNGEFELKLPLGTFSISFIHKDYSTTTLHNISLNRNKVITETILMRPSGLELEEFVVLSPSLKSSVNALLEVRRGHSTVADLIGSEQISKSGDSDAGSSLRRVTGLSLVDGKYVYVRGLGERYSNTLLNNSSIPSPDPMRRVVPLDLFPASVIENMVVQKGYSPEMPGEFGGGVIQIKTKTLPAKKYVKFSVSSQLESVGNVRSYEGGGKDWMGFDDGKRSLPESISRLVGNGVNISSLESEERKALGQEIRKSYNIKKLSSSDKNKVPNFTISTGNKFRLGKAKIGYNLSSLYQNNWSLNEEDKTSYNLDGEDLVENSTSKVKKSKNNIKLGALLGVGVKYRKHEINYNGSLLRTTENLVKESEGLNSEKDEFQKAELIWRERSIESHQLSGKSNFKALNNSKLSWNYSYSKAQLDQPDSKMYTYKKLDGIYNLETEDGSSSNNISWRDMVDRVRDMGISYEQPFDFGSVEGAKMALGLKATNRKRELNSKTFYYKFDEGSSVDTTKSPDVVFSDNASELYQLTNNTDSYNGHQSIDAYFGNVTIPISKLVLTTGFRFEKSLQEVKSIKLFSGDNTLSTLETKDYLPVFSLNYKIIDNLQLRANYSETISRPELREISNTVWRNVDEGKEYQGNPRLDSAQIENIGARLEWFPQRGEVLSVGYFRKKFTKPIEEIFGAINEFGEVIQGGENSYTFFNIDRATSQGIEFEFRKKLFWNFTLGGNYTWIKSDVSIAQSRAGQLTNLVRPLQGQSPYLMNIQLDFEPKDWGTYSFLYNTIGQRITSVGTEGRPDEYQGKVGSFDFVSSQKIRKNWNVKFKAKNILDPEVKNTQGSQITKLTKKGRSYSLGLSASF